LPIKILLTFTGLSEELTTPYDVAKSPVGDIVQGGTNSDLTDTDNYLRENGSEVGVTENGGAATEDGIHEQAAGKGVPEIVLEDVDRVGEWHTR